MDWKVPENVLPLVEAAVKANPTDIEKAAHDAAKKIKKLPEFPEIMAQLFQNAVREIVYDVRHAMNVRTKRQAGYYGQEAKVNRVSDGVLRSYESVYSYYIGGTVLGDIKGEALRGIAENERAIAVGHTFNAKLCEWLAEQVPEDKAVREVIPEKCLRKEFDRIYKQTMGEEAA